MARRMERADQSRAARLLSQNSVEFRQTVCNQKAV